MRRSNRRPADVVARDGSRWRRVHATDEAYVRAGMADIEAGRGIVLTGDEARRWAKTGEWPESLD